MALFLEPDAQRNLRHIPAALHTEFPDVIQEDLEAEVETVTREVLATARIDSFVPVLVHRFARERLLERGVERSGSVDRAQRSFLASSN